jgi:hypothetical protein
MLDDFNCLTCHIIGLNPISKKELIETMNIKVFNPIDLDDINNSILNDTNMNSMFKSYHKLKENKNDKFKDLEKKMTVHWENKFLELLGEKVKLDKKNILIGKNNHYKNLARKINLNTLNKFYIKNTEDDIKQLIKYNVDNYKSDIVSGVFPLEYLDYNYLSKKKDNLIVTYKKSGYIEKDFEQIKTILKLLEDKIIDIPGLWVALKDPYNLGSKIHPIKNDKIMGYLDPNMALLGSFNFSKDELKKNYNGKEIRIKELKSQSLDKLKTKRFLYLVDKNPFIPHEKGANQKFFSQTPVTILQKEKIEDVYEYILPTKPVEDNFSENTSKNTSKKEKENSSKVIKKIFTSKESKVLKKENTSKTNTSKKEKEHTSKKEKENSSKVIKIFTSKENKVSKKENPKKLKNTKKDN